MKHFLWLSIVLILLTLLYITLLSGKNKNKTLSQHIATNKIYKIIFFVICLLAVSSSSLTLFLYIPSKIPVNIIYYILIGIITISLITLSAFPDTKGISAKIYNIAAWTMAYSMLPVITYIYFLDNNLLSFVSIFAMILLQVKLKLSKANILYIQISYILIFLANILYFTYAV